jgi:cell division septum initiation protein DivIVA
MRYTPVELRHIRVGRSLFGYKRHDIDKLLEDIADSFEEVWSERGELADKVEDLGKILSDVKERESLLAATLVSAERAAADARDQAKKEAELIVAEAHIEARSVTRGAQGERDRLFGEVRRVETLLRAALGMVEETRQELPASSEAGEEEEEWPKREDTREFQAAIHPDVAPQAAETDEPSADDVPKLPPVQSVTGGPEDDDSPSPGRNFSWG